MSYDPGSSDDPGRQQQPPPKQPGGPEWQNQPYPGAGAGAGAYGQQPPPPGWGPAGPPPGGPPPAGYGYPGGPGGPGGPAAPTTANSFFGALFDFGFNHFATPTVIKVLYVFGIVIIGLTWIGFVITGFASSIGAGLLALIGGAIAAMFYIILFRVMLEFFYAVVRMSEDIHHRR